MKLRLSLLAAFTAVGTFFSSAEAAPADTLALTPPMGWNSWNLFEDRVSEELIKGVADEMAANGMRDAGYQYIIIDDFWVGGRDSRNQLFPDPKRFPNGIKHLADYVHSKGLKLGIYSDAAQLTCGGVTGSLNFEELDAQTFANWGIDYLKYDYCGAPDDVTTAFTRYKKMGDALKKTGRPIVYAICEWGQRQPWLWAKAAGGHLWRTTFDSRDVWQSNDSWFMGIVEILDLQEGIARYGGPGGWNDPDLLMVGLYGKGKSSSAGPNGQKYKGCTDTEYRTSFALWSIMSAPLIVNLDVANMNKATKDILLNKELIAINQDKLGKTGESIIKKDGLQVFRKELSNGRVAILVFNRNEKATDFNYSITKDLDLYAPYSIKDVFAGREFKAKELKGKLDAHDCKVYVFSKAK